MTGNAVAGMMYVSIIDPPRWANLNWSEHNQTYWLRSIEILNRHSFVDAAIYQRIDGSYVWKEYNEQGSTPYSLDGLDHVDIAARLILRYPER